MEVTTPDCHKTGPHSPWPVWPFKTNYTIQMPATYQGTGLTGFEGNLFSKYNSDSTIVLSYTYCDAISCQDFGDELSQQDATSVLVAVGNSSKILDKRICLCDNNGKVGLFFISDNQSDRVIGRLFWKDSASYREALTATFTLPRQDEVIEILKTIRKK